MINPYKIDLDFLFSNIITINKVSNHI